MVRLLLLDISIGPEDIVEEASRNPLVVIAFIAVAGLLLFFGIRLIRRELKKKKGQPVGEQKPVEEMQPTEEKQPVEEMQPAPEADHADITEEKS